MRDISGRHALVTGASHGIGPWIARALAARGASVSLAARSQDELERVRDELAAKGVRAAVAQTDLSDPVQRDGLVARAESDLGRVDILVNNAGIEPFAAFEQTPEELERIVAINLVAAMVLTRAVLPRMLAAGSGHVVNVSSLAGKAGPPYSVAYAATKFGLVGFSHALRAELQGTGVGVSVVCPGFVSEEGMFARMGSRPPVMLGASSPQRVAAAVLDAILRDRADVIVNPIPMRPLIALTALLPAASAPIMKLFGVTEMHRRFARR